jgi:hypothetical protein
MHTSMQWCIPFPASMSPKQPEGNPTNSTTPTSCLIITDFHCGGIKKLIPKWKILELVEYLKLTTQGDKHPFFIFKNI